MKASRFDQVFESGRRVRGALLTLIVSSGSGQFGVATSRKIGSKPQRNRVKRRIKVGMQGHRFAQHDLVAVASERCKRASFAEVQADIDQLIQKCQL